MRCACAILSYVACLALPYFSTFSHKRHDFLRKKKLLNTKCVFWFSLQLLSETFLVLRRTERDVIKKVNTSSSKVPFILVRFLSNFNFLDSFSKNCQISNFMKIRPEEAELFHADGWTDMKLKFALRSSSSFSIHVSQRDVPDNNNITH